MRKYLISNYLTPILGCYIPSLVSEVFMFFSFYGTVFFTLIGVSCLLNMLLDVFFPLPESKVA